MDRRTPLTRWSRRSPAGSWDAGSPAWRCSAEFRSPSRRAGDARFAAPRPAHRWDGVREAFSFGPPPPQDPGMPGAVSPSGVAAGDDWLTVNVWTPDPGPAARRPVMVWIYGGAYRVGSADTPGYDASHLARDGDLVVVTFNHRVGVEGFASIDGAPANRGLLDQVAALEWVRDNITAFGGDPDQVTVFGESAGAGSIAALMAMPRAAGLFHRAIAQSVPGTYFSDALAKDVAAAISAELRLGPSVADLSGVDPSALAAAGAAVAARLSEYADRWGQVALTPTPFSPVVDGDVLPSTPWQALAGGSGREVHLVTGHNRDEFRLFIAHELGQVDEARAARALRVFGPGPDGARAYRGAYPDATAAQLYELVQSDWLFRMPSLHLAEAQLAGGGQAHMYELTWTAPAHGGFLGACHGLDVPLVFGNLHSPMAQMLLGSEPPPAAELLSRQFRTAWTTFAAAGDPGWPRYDSHQRLTRVFDVDPLVTAYPETESRRLWHGHSFDALPLL
ncbi:carboxylesterase/lipase family protein [Lentzea pudingi]|uniref:carboxylesterase/lipase family protein n=1 Tax=Lentzea pudingi TaxID=1789439 RepID=UPI0027E3C5EE|nr:carboxylesterase family protein [Lentzea pudingi]